MSKTDIGDVMRQAVSSKGENNRVLALWEWHGKDVASTLFNQNASSLAQEGVTDLFLELPIWMNPVIDAYRDGKISRSDFQDKYLRPALNFPEATERFTDTIDTAFANDIDVFCVNGRKTRERALEEIIRSDPDLKVDLVARKAAILRADQWRELYPQALVYEKMAVAMHEHNIPNDTIAATLVREKLGASDGRGVMIYGAGHFAGTVKHKQWTETDGILDEALEAQGVSVFNIETLNNRDDLIDFERTKVSFENCKTAAKQNITYFGDTDEAVVSSHQLRNPFGLPVENGEDLDLCWGVVMKPVSELYTRPQLNPFADLKAGLDIIHAIEAEGPGNTPVAKGPASRKR